MKGGNSKTSLGYIPTVGHSYNQTKKGLEELTLPFFSWSLALWSLTNLHFFTKQSCSLGLKLSWQPGWGFGTHPSPQTSVEVTERTKPVSLTSFNLQVFLQKVWPLLPSLLLWKQRVEGGEGSTCTLFRRMLFCLCSSSDCQGIPFLNPDQAWAWTWQGAAPFGSN